MKKTIAIDTAMRSTVMGIHDAVWYSIEGRVWQHVDETVWDGLSDHIWSNVMSLIRGDA